MKLGGLLRWVVSRDAIGQDAGVGELDEVLEDLEITERAVDLVAVQVCELRLEPDRGFAQSRFVNCWTIFAAVDNDEDVAALCVAGTMLVTILGAILDKTHSGTDTHPARSGVSLMTDLPLAPCCRA